MAPERAGLLLLLLLLIVVLISVSPGEANGNQHGGVAEGGLGHLFSGKAVLLLMADRAVLLPLTVAPAPH